MRKQKVRTVISVVFIAFGLGLAAAVGCSFWLSSADNSIKADAFGNAQSTIDEAGESGEASDTEQSSENYSENDSNGNSDSVNENISADTDEMNVDVDKLYEDSVAYNEELQTTQYNMLTTTSYTYSALDLTDYGITNGVYAYISAPSIDMNLPIYLGATYSNMAYGATHLCYTSLPTGGENNNVVLSSHSGYIGRWLFDSLPNLQIGDTVTIQNYWGDTDYTVTEKLTRSPDDGQDLYITKGKDKLTLITCVSDGNGGYNRCVVICERQDSEDSDE